MSLNSENKNNPLEIQKNLVQQSPVYMFACTKAQRLVTAVHLMTRHVGEQEPLRMSLRNESVSLLAQLHVHDMRVSEDALLERISLLESLLDAALYTGLVSEINHTVVRKEYGDLKRFVKERGGIFGSAETVVGDSFFDIPEPPKETIEGPKKTYKELAEAPGKEAPVAIKVKTNTKRQNVSKTQTKSRTTSSKTKAKQTGRRDAILRLVRDQEQVSVRDVALVVTGVSEKTLQRELLSLVEEGVLKKEGERRWSTYSFA